ncbi:carbohydrate ABC transporter permease [Phytoactinopolyspora halotolerans]|uniref:Sugar ABC transporter permease n=1 Tax=Phytoactinopolyspora halotolerans TaxID=1981512 RepID=A0A6L9S9J0_9ACTN|nr:sugar ABC transporter permease [Phytoactinopolyspora halotolerans]NEE01232.1 sugar ABC transporter permease [Phytoactinopolyspora halotolerans]
MTETTLTARAGTPEAPGAPGAPGSVGRRTSRARWMRRARRHGPVWVPWLFLAPALILFLLFKFIPMGQALVMSFQDVQPFLGNQWVGTANYETLVGSPDFQSAVWHTSILAVGQTAGSMFLGFTLALLLEGQAKRLWFVRSAAFLPVVAPMAVIAEVWRIMYHPTSDGLANQIIGWVTLDPSQWINSPDTSLWSVMIVGIWRGAPYDMIIIVAGLVSVDRSLYEAAALDGAGILQRIRYVTIPALRPVIVILLTLAAIRGMRVFTEVYLLTNGGPNGSSEVVMTLIYKLGFERGDLGVAAAGSVVLFVATVLLTLLVQFARRRDR